MKNMLGSFNTRIPKIFRLCELEVARKLCAIVIFQGGEEAAHYLLGGGDDHLD